MKVSANRLKGIIIVRPVIIKFDILNKHQIFSYFLVVFIREIKYKNANKIVEVITKRHDYVKKIVMFIV